MEKLENGKNGIKEEVMELLGSVPDSVVIKVKGGAAQESGLPDFYFTCAALGGRSVWIELKQLGEGPKKLQGYKLDRLRRAGAVAETCHSVVEVEQLLSRLGVQVREEADWERFYAEDEAGRRMRGEVA